MDAARVEDAAGMHPRPQLTRARWTDLSGTWQFGYDDRDEGLRDRWYERPLDDRSNVGRSSAARSGCRSRRSPRRAASATTASTRCSGTAPPSSSVPDPGGALLLHLGAVDHRARVWVNGRLVAVHEGGHTPFSVDVTAALTGRRPACSSSAPRTTRATSSSPAASRTGRSARTPSGTSGRAASGSPSGSSRCPPPGSSAAVDPRPRRGRAAPGRARSRGWTTGRCA